MAATSRAALHTLATDQHGHFSTSQALAQDVSRRTLAALLAAEEIVRVHRGVYRMASTPLTWRGRLMAAVLAAGPGAVASHAWAAKLYEMERVWTPTKPDVCIPWQRTAVVPGVSVHRSRDLRSCDTTTVDKIPTTSPARMNVDLAAGLSAAQTMALTDDLICAKKTSRAWQYERACSLAAGRAGVDVIMRITRPGAEGEFWSWLERRFHVAIVTAYDLPVPQYNVPLRDTEGLIGYADVCWELARSVVVELDGLRFHRLTKARGKDSRKANRYALSGRIPLRFTYQDVVGNPEQVARTVKAALEQARAPASPSDSPPLGGSAPGGG